ncbi:ABC transporter ATP-binding protein [Microbispora cellulosiformans]|uniref:ABC transporter ATP-binding protein n=1 Tax=Microbispora cellulosiformans TaxID=2614688 RepID=A0A5J5JVS4_9ACTN|nr:ABC transporter ATP-binding protein [Microbispora cellulosiformans]KAA9373897.1 ABC transporter ATP-binding protein [Microbispora cellulosiformans]
MEARTTGARRGVEVTLRGLTKRFGQGDGRIVAADDVSLHVPAGQRVAVVGASGSGKSTLLHLIGGMERVDGGTITVGDREVTALGRRELSVYRRSVGFVFQRFHLLPALTVLDNVLAPVLPRRVDFDRTERGRQLLAAVGLLDRAHAVPSQLSGGQQQRVAVARALIGEPRLILADEPTGNLDSATGREVMELVDRLVAEQGLTLLVATHDDGVAAHCDRIIRIRDGRIVDDTTR